MKTSCFKAAGILLCLCVWSHEKAQAGELAAGGTFNLGNQHGVVKVLDTLPYVNNTYTQRMIWQKHDDPRLSALRKNLRLDNAVLSGKDEFERQLRLMDFVNRLWEYGDPRNHRKAASPESIVEYLKQEERFYCEQYACVMAGCAASMGWVYRLLSHDGHTWGEIWSNQYGKWLYFDARNNFWATDAGGHPLNMAEVRDDFFRNKGKNIVVRLGPEGNKKSAEGRYGSYDLVGYHPNTNLMDERFDYTKMFIIKDQFSRGSNIRGQGEPVANPLVDPYFPINQASLSLKEASSGLAVSLKTFTPNFKTFRCRVNDGVWRNCGEEFSWNLRPGKNLLEVKSVNQFEVDGPLSRAEIEVTGESPASTPAALGSPAPEENGKSAGMPALKLVPPEGLELQPVAYEEKLKDEWLSMWHTQGQWVEWAFEAPQAGEYTASIYYCTSYNPRRELQVNGKVVPGLEAFALSYTGGWRSWKKAELPVKLTLSGGRNTLRLTSRNDEWAWVKAIRLSRPGLAQDLTIEAFNFTAQGGGTVQKTFIQTNGFIMSWDQKGHWLEWTVEAPAGTYDVFVRVGALVTAVREMKVNGELIENSNAFQLSPTGGWRTWSEMPFGKAKLKAGKNVIRMENMNGEGMNLNAIRLLGPGGRQVFINATDFTAQGGGQVEKMK